MCGIAGIVSLDGQPVLDRELRSMCSAMVHRGPDDEGVYLAPGVVSSCTSGACGAPRNPPLAERRRGFFNASYVENCLTLHNPGQNLDLHLWTLISFGLWSRAFLDRDRTGPDRVAA